MKIRSHKELRVWQDAMDAAMALFVVSREFPAEERYSLTDQVRRCTRSVPANLSEAWRKRRYPAAFISKLSDAEGEAAEAQTFIELALRCGYLSPEQAIELDKRYEAILGQIVTMINQPEKWTVSSPSSVRPHVPVSPRPSVPVSPDPQFPSSPGPHVPSSPGPHVPPSPSPHVPQSADPGVPSSPCPHVPKSPCPQVPPSPSPHVPKS